MPAHDFEWDATGKANIFVLGDLEVKIEDLIIADTDGVAPELEGTAGDSDFFASLVCGNAVVGSTAPVAPLANGKVTISEDDFLFNNDVSKCEGAIVLVRADEDDVSDLDMFGVAGGGGFMAGDGRIFIVDQDDGSLNFVGDPLDAGQGFSGFAFDLTGRVFATRTNNPETAALVELDPATFDVLEILPFEPNNPNEIIPRVRDLAVQPGTNRLFGFTTLGMVPDNLREVLVIIDKDTGDLTEIGNTGTFHAGIAFAPDGTLYATTDQDFGTPNANSCPDQTIVFTIETMDPDTAEVLQCVETVNFFDGLAVRPNDGTVFGTRSRDNGVYTIDPDTGVQVLVGAQGNGVLLSDLAFPAGIDPWVAVSGF